jgi:PAS domain S-box-containing protein
LIPVLLTVAAVALNRQFRSEVGWVSHAYEVRTAIRETLVSVWSADRNLHNYALTGDEGYLRGTQTDAAQARDWLHELQGLVADNPVQQRNLARLQPVLEATLANQQWTLEHWRAGGLRAALNPAEIGRTERSMEQIRQAFDDMMQEEAQTLLARTRRERQINLETEVVFALATLVTLGLLLWAARLLRENAAKRDQAERELQQKVHEIEALNQGLERRVSERTAQLQRSNRKLACSNEANRLLASVVESSDDAIIARSVEGVIESWNAGAERLYGYRADEIIGHNIRELLPPGRAEEEAGILERLRHGQAVEHFETVRLRKGGAPVDVSITISPIRDDSGRIVGASHISRDITEQKNHEEAMRQAQKLESLGVLAGGIAHDFNNLLVGIIGNASLAAESVPDYSPAMRNIEDVIAAGERAAGLTRQMLAYSGKGRFVIDRIDLSAYVRETVPLLGAAIPRTVALRLELADNLPAIEADAAQMQQLVMNLVINGAEAIPEGKPGTVTVRTRLEHLHEESVGTQPIPQTHDSKPGPYVVLEVRDTGAGMDPAIQSKIFDPFFTTKFTGRGLGLAAVLGIVRGHGGFIEVSSAPGQGTVFRVWLPALAARVERPAKARETTRDLSGAGTVLVIDDEELVRNLARQTLEHYGYRVLLAEEGAGGVEVLRREMDRVDCVVLDLTMPVMSGEEALPQLKALRPGVPVILSSGFSEAEAVGRFAGKGLAAFIQKPYKAAELAEKVKDVMAAAGTPAHLQL